MNEDELKAEAKKMERNADDFRLSFQPQAFWKSKDVRGLILLAQMKAIVIALAVLAVLFALLFSYRDAHAKRPAEVTIIGTPSSHIAECEQHRAFAESVIAYRDGGGTLDDAQEHVAAEAKRLAWPVDKSVTIGVFVEIVWRQRGDSEEVGRRVFEACMKGRT